MSNLTLEKYGLTQLDYCCMRVLYDLHESTTNNMLRKLEARAVLPNATDGNTHYDTVKNAMEKLKKLNIVSRTQLYKWDNHWWLTNYGEKLLKAFIIDGDE